MQGDRLIAGTQTAWRRRRQLRLRNRQRSVTSRFSSRHHLAEVASGDRDRRSEPQG